eukprot:5969098-Prymnesium_polylepis.1
MRVHRPLLPGGQGGRRGGDWLPAQARRRLPYRRAGEVSRQELWRLVLVVAPAAARARPRHPALPVQEAPRAAAPRASAFPARRADAHATDACRRPRAPSPLPRAHHRTPHGQVR